MKIILIRKSFLQRTKFVLCVFAVWCAFCFAGVLSRSGFAGSEVRSNREPAEELRVNTRNLTYRDGNCTVVVNYPSVGNSKVDAELDYWVYNTVQTFTSGIETIKSSGQGRCSMVVDYTLSEPSAPFISIVFRIVTDMGGGIPYSGMAAFTYDLDDGRRLGYPDVFEDADGLLYFLSLYAHEVLLARLGDTFDSRVREGTKPDFFNFLIFTLTPDGITLFFPPDQVADQSLGEQDVCIALEKLKPYKPRPEIWSGNGGSFLGEQPIYKISISH